MNGYSLEGNNSAIFVFFSPACSILKRKEFAPVFFTSRPQLERLLCCGTQTRSHKNCYCLSKTWMCTSTHLLLVYQYIKLFHILHGGSNTDDMSFKNKEKKKTKQLFGDSINFIWNGHERFSLHGHLSLTLSGRKRTISYLWDRLYSIFSGAWKVCHGHGLRQLIGNLKSDVSC